MEVHIEDSRCRKMLGYRNRYTTPQMFRSIVDTVETEQAM